MPYHHIVDAYAPWAVPQVITPQTVTPQPTPMFPNLGLNPYDIGSMPNINQMIKAIGPAPVGEPGAGEPGGLPPGMGGLGAPWTGGTPVPWTGSSPALPPQGFSALPAYPPVLPPQTFSAPPQTFSFFNDLTGKTEYFSSEEAMNSRTTWLTADAARRNALQIPTPAGPTPPVVTPAPVGEPGAGEPGGLPVTGGGLGMSEIGTFAGGDTRAPWGDWSNVFGELTPSAQYQAMMRTSMPNYALPGYQSMATRQFDPTFGRYLMQGYGAGGAGPTTTGLGTGTGFADWYGGQFSPTAGAPAGGVGGVGTFSPTGTMGDIGAGWELAKQYSGMTPGGADWRTLRGSTPGMAYAMQDPEAVRAMALSKYYGGGQPTGGYAGRAVASTLQNMYNDWQAGQVQAGNTAPSGYLNYLGGLTGSKWA